MLFRLPIVSASWATLRKQHVPDQYVKFLATCMNIRLLMSIQIRKAKNFLSIVEYARETP